MSTMYIINVRSNIVQEVCNKDKFFEVYQGDAHFLCSENFSILTESKGNRCKKKESRIQNFLWSEISVIWTEYRKMLTRKNPPSLFYTIYTTLIRF